MLLKAVVYSETAMIANESQDSTTACGSANPVAAVDPFSGQVVMSNSSKDRLGSKYINSSRY